MNKQLIFVATLIFSAILMAESVWAASYLSAARKKNMPFFQPDGPKMILRSDSEVAKPGQHFTVSLNVDPKAGQVQALDARINYDKDKLSVLEIKPLINIEAVDYPSVTFDNETGSLIVSMVLPGDPISTPSSVANIIFEAKSTGTTQISLQFKPGDTRDSNVVLFNNVNDSLSGVQDAKVTIQP